LVVVCWKAEKNPEQNPEQNPRKIDITVLTEKKQKNVRLFPRYNDFSDRPVVTKKTSAYSPATTTSATDQL
jgi:hypothetical protein